MHKALAAFSVDSLKAERAFRAMTIGNFRKPLPHFTPCQIASEMALAAGGTLYLPAPDTFTRSTLKHVAYLWRHMTHGDKQNVRPLIVLAFHETRPFTRDAHNYIHISKLFSPIEPLPA